MAAPRGNKNRAGKVKAEEERVAPALTTSVSMNSRRMERLRQAIEWHEGYVPEDEEVLAKARNLFYEAIDQYCHATERDREGAIIL